MHAPAPIPPTTFPEQSRIVLQQLEEMLDELIGCQREEQECILSRDISRLPQICEKIGALSVRLDRHQLNLRTFLQARPLPAPQEKLRLECVSKFKRMQELARQNHMLLEHSLRFLQQVMGEFLGSRRKQGTYNQLGVFGGSYTGSGLLMELKI